MQNPEYERGYLNGAKDCQKTYGAILNKICEALEEKPKKTTQEFWLGAGNNVFNDLYEIVDNNMVAISSCLPYTPGKNESEIPLKDGNIFIVHFADMTFFIPRYVFIGNKFYLLEEIKKKRINKTRRVRMMQDIMERNYCLIRHDPSMQLATLIYKNMTPERRRKKNGKELKRYLNQHKTAAATWCINKDKTEQLEDLLNICDFSCSAINNVIRTSWNEASLEARTCLQDALRKTYVLESC